LLDYKLGGKEVINKQIVQNKESWKPIITGLDELIEQIIDREIKAGELEQNYDDIEHRREELNKILWG